MHPENSEIITENDTQLLNTFTQFEEEIEEESVPEEEQDSQSTKELKIKVLMYSYVIL